MSIPTFAGVALVSRAARDLPGCPAVRVRTETMPGADGAYVQPHGRGARRISVRGLLEADAETAPAAHEALKSALRARQALADGATVGAYVGTDGAAYADCVLLSCEPDGDVGISRCADGCRAHVFLKAEVLQPAP